MIGMTENDVLLSLIAFAILLLATRAVAELARRVGQPEVLGELLGGFLIGPSALGALFPKLFQDVFGQPVVAHGMSLLSWIGAILLLLIAGIEADLVILRQKAIPGLLSAGGAIGSSLVLASIVAVKLMHRTPESGFFLGLVYSVTAVSVVAKLLIERGALRRGYAQVMLAGGIASEVLVWPLISVVSSLHNGGNPWTAGFKSAFLAIAFFALMLTVGRRFTFWAMRRVADMTGIANGELSLILLLVSVSAIITAAAGLHPLLGAFVFGVLLSRAPRATVALKERIQALTVSFFAPIFFGLAGMRVNLFDLHGASSVEGILLLLFGVGLVKILFGFLGAKAGRLPAWESASIGIGLNLKGGSDVVVAIVGTELGLLSPNLYTMYAVVAILTVLITPPILARISARALPDESEVERLNHEEARRRAYFADMERVLLPDVPELRPDLVASLIEQVARAKSSQSEIFDITELSTTGSMDSEAPVTTETAQVARWLTRAVKNEHVSLQKVVIAKGPLAAVLEAAQTQQIIMIGSAAAREGAATLSFGPMHDVMIRDAACDVLVAVHTGSVLPVPKRILVPVNGLEHSLAAADVAAYLASACNAELVLFNIAHTRLEAMFWKEGGQRDVLQRGYTIVREAEFRVARLGAWVSTRVRLGADPGAAILNELKRRPYSMVVMGGIGRTTDGGLALGNTIEHVMTQATLPRILVVSRNIDFGE